MKLLLILLMFMFSVFSPAQNFKHPGIIYSQESLNRIEPRFYATLTKDPITMIPILGHIRLLSFLGLPSDVASSPNTW